MLMYIPTGAKLEIMNQISDQFDSLRTEREFTEKFQKLSRCKSYAQRVR